MTITYGFFNSVDGDRLYNADDMSHYYKGLVTDGVLANYEDRLMVVENTGMSVLVQSGRAYIDGKYIELDAAEVLDIEQSSTNLNRIDAVMLRKSNADRNITLYIKKGTVAEEPTAPTVERSASVTELCLATIQINKLAEEIKTVDITDTRMDSSRCGYVTGLVDFLDTTQLFTQWTEAFNEWFTQMKAQLTELLPATQQNSSYTTTGSAETNIPINISSYNMDLDILFVFVNGFKMIKGTDYTQTDSSNIVLTKAVDKGTVVEFTVIQQRSTSS